MILPMIGQTGSFQRPSADLGDVQDLYLHGYVSSRIMRLSREPGEAEEETGLPVAVAASHVDGIVLALTPNSHSYVGLPSRCFSCLLRTSRPARGCRAQTDGAAAELPLSGIVRLRQSRNRRR